ncbi:perlucin-like [Mya arenaria]|uniref:perlucin-like n=1 Tax=Mya arenaria TaxID=6604 RepID=UPI0022E17A0C|nr:perlucin-like [Mya arenaria]XP_052762240.1 perlucin-like [Mya arenaria]
MFGVLVLLSLTGFGYSACPQGWQSDYGHCYQFNTSNRKTWTDAATACRYEDVRAHLVYIDSAEEDLYIVSKLKPLVDTGQSSDKLTSVWIGGEDPVEGAWQWYGTGDPIVEYTNWYPGQPDSGSGDHDEDCVCLVGNHNYLWQDHRCTEPMFYVCDME